MSAVGADGARIHSPMAGIDGNDDVASRRRCGVRASRGRLRRARWGHIDDQAMAEALTRFNIGFRTHTFLEVEDDAQAVGLRLT